jgi:hypothetical protein
MIHRNSGTPIEGGCFCREIRYRATGEPTNSMICHCQTCRRVSGSPVVAWVTVLKSQFQFIHGEPGELCSSKPVRRTFCRSCGTPLTYEHSDSSLCIDITTCSLDDPGAFPPTYHSWLSHDIAWVRFGDGLSTFEQSRQ